MADHRANVEDMDGVNADKLFEAVEFEDIKGTKSHPTKKSNNTECLIGLSDDNTNHAKKFVQPSEICVLNKALHNLLLLYNG